MWRLSNNSNQVPITLSIFGVVLTFVQYFFCLPEYPEYQKFLFRVRIFQCRPQALAANDQMTQKLKITL